MVTETERKCQKNTLFIAVIGVMLLIMAPARTVHAQEPRCATNPDLQSCTSNYGVSESFFGSGGQDNCPVLAGETNSQTYCALMSAGELTVGNTAGTDYQAYGGFNTFRTPYLEMAFVGSANLDLNDPATKVARTAQANTGSVQFQVKAYLASQYVVQIAGSTPTYGSKSIPGLTSGGASTPGTEQFGINLVANTAPAVGAAAQQDPDSTFAFGYAAPGYNTANNFRYNNGDIIAQSDKSTSFTLYTISYLLNVANNTPAGVYNTDQSIVATATY